MTKANHLAFPVAENGQVNEDATGLTKREYFAAMALQGHLANSADIAGHKPITVMQFDEIARLSVSAADALIAELNKPKN